MKDPESIAPNIYCMVVRGKEVMMTTNLEDKALLYSGLADSELIGKIVVRLYHQHHPSALTVIQAERTPGEGYVYQKHYAIYMPKEEYELNLGIC